MAFAPAPTWGGVAVKTTWLPADPTSVLTPTKLTVAPALRVRAAAVRAIVPPVPWVERTVEWPLARARPASAWVELVAATLEPMKLNVPPFRVTVDPAGRRLLTLAAALSRVSVPPALIV